jgi:hypothetical protein
MPRARMRAAIPKSAKAGDFVWFFDDDLAGHCNERHFENDANVNDIFFQIGFKGFDQLYADEHEQEVGEDSEQSLNRNEEARRLYDLLADEYAQVDG